MADDMLLEVDDLTVTYGPVLALEHVSLRVPAGGAVALLGANGAGKSTLLRTVSGLLRFHRGSIRSGSIRFDGRQINGADTARLVAAGLSQTLEGRRIFADLTVGENLKLGGFSARDRRREGELREELLTWFPVLAERLASPAGLLSGGEQQMLAIARALMAQPRLLLLDEPSLGLAPQIVAQIGDALRRVREAGTALLLVDQSTTLALHVTDDGYLLENGTVRAQGATRRLLLDDDVRASYLGTGAGAEHVVEEVAR